MDGKRNHYLFILFKEDIYFSDKKIGIGILVWNHLGVQLYFMMDILTGLI